MTMPQNKPESSFSSSDLETQKILASLQSDLRAVGHKAGNTAQSVDNLVRIIHTDKDSIVSQMARLSTSFDNLKEERSSIYKDIEKCDKRLQKVEVATHDLTRDFASRQKFNNMINAAAIAFLVPAVFTGIFWVVSSVTAEKAPVAQTQ